jgi:hypothetical protein
MVFLHSYVSNERGRADRRKRIGSPSRQPSNPGIPQTDSDHLPLSLNEALGLQDFNGGSGVNGLNDLNDLEAAYREDIAVGIRHHSLLGEDFTLKKAWLSLQTTPVLQTYIRYSSCYAGRPGSRLARSVGR